MPDPILLRLISICINWLRINIIIININIIIIAIAGIGTACSLAMDFLLSLSPFSNTDVGSMLVQREMELDGQWGMQLFG